MARRGPLPFSEVVDAALYDPELGFYATGGVAGRRGDFLTSPEVGPLFGAAVARALDGWWREAGEPDPWVVVEAGAGPGTLARTVLAARPACAPALRYVLVERSAALRAVHPAHLPWSQPREVELRTPGGGPVVTSLGELPAGLEVPVVVLANELLDNLAFDVLERRPGGWAEVRAGGPPPAPAGGPPAGAASGPPADTPVGAAGVGTPVGTAGAGTAGDATAGRDFGAPTGTAAGTPAGSARGLVEVIVPAPPEVAERAAALAPDAPTGARIPLQHAAAQWLAGALAVAERTRVVVIDYTTPTTAELAERGGWLRTYRAHDRGGPPLADLGTQDITCDVAEDQLAKVRPPVSRRTQAEALAAWGVHDLVEEGRRIWAERASVGDLAALRARSRVREAEALLDPDGLGAFTVLEWES